MNKPYKSQRGAALIIVLLLTATLSFIALALVSAMSLSARRTSGAALRGEVLWRAVSAETIAAVAISEALRQTGQGGPTLSLDHPLFSQQLSIPFADGGGAIIFTDATRCFNVNSLTAPGGDRDEALSPVRELIEVLKAAGLSEGEAANIAAVAKDWVDENDIQEIGGAEDGFYTSLPTPYRTGRTELASVTELRAMQGVTDEIFAAVSPHLCAHPNTTPSKINVNALRPTDAPLLTGLTGGVLDVATAEDLVSSRPPGGWASADQFWASPALQNDDIDRQALSSRTAVSSAYIEALAGATVNEIDMNVRLFFSTDESGANVSLISRELNSGA